MYACLRKSAHESMQWRASFERAAMPEEERTPPNHATACISVRAREHSERTHTSEAFEQLDLCCL